VQSVDELKALYKEGEYERVRALAAAALNEGARDGWLCLLAAKSSARLGRAREFSAAMRFWRDAGGDAPVLAMLTFVDLLGEAQYHPILAAASEFVPEDPLWIVATYYAGCAALMLGERRAAMERFKAFRLGWPRYLGKIDFLGDDRLNVMFRQGRLVADADEVARRMSAPCRFPALEYVGGTQASRVVFASGNDHYFNAMGQAFVDGALPFLGDALLHLHVIGPDGQARDIAAQLAARHGGRIAFSFEAEPLFRTYTYYSCSRFYAIPALLARYRAPILSLDIDIAPTIQLAELFRAARGFDFCCFRMGRREPASIYQASAMHWADSEAARALLDGLAHFCWGELGNPSRATWMLDQAALFSLLDEPAAGLRFGEFATLTGREPQDCVRILFDNDAKAELRERARKEEPTSFTVAAGGTL